MHVVQLWPEMSRNWKQVLGRSRSHREAMDPTIQGVPEKLFSFETPRDTPEGFRVKGLRV